MLFSRRSIRLKPTPEALQEANPGVDHAVIQAHLNRMPDAYFEANAADDIAGHLARVASLSPEEPVSVQVTGDVKAARCTVVAFDTQGVFSLLTGILASLGFGIRSGEIFTSKKPPEPTGRRRPRRRPLRKTSRGPAALQRRYIVDSLEGRIDTPLDLPAWQAELQRRLTATLGVLEKDYRDARKTAKHWVIEEVTRFLADHHEVEESRLYPVQIDIANDAGPFTRVTVTSQDTPAFLYSLGMALSLQNLSIERISIRTEAGRIIDTFDLVDARGAPIESESMLAKLRFSIALTKQFTYFLEQAPDPYAALARFEHLVEEVVTLPDPEQWRRNLSDPHLMRELSRLLGASDYLWEDFVRSQYETVVPMMMTGDATPFAEPAEPVRDRLQRAVDEADTPEDKREALNVFKNQEVFHSDLSQLLDPAVDFREFAERLTRLAEAVVAVSVDLAYHELKARHGEPQTVAGLPAAYAVFGLGKFGGAALGYASDIELLFVYSDQGRTVGRDTIPNNAFFDALVQSLKKVIQAKREGIFQLDLRLRPHGKSGPPACSLEAFCEYYGPAGSAHSFEKLSLVRLRAVAGDEELGHRVERLRDEYIFASPSIVVADLQALRARQFKEKSVTGRINAKYDPGGLVDLEYAVQMLQVMHGKGTPALRSPRIHVALDQLTDAEVLAADECARLNRAYDFLRRLINGLRMLRGSAKDLFLPAETEEEYKHLARRMGYLRKGEITAATRLHLEFETHTAAVRAFVERHFGRALLPGPATGSVADLILADNAPEDLRERILAGAGFRNTPRAYVNLRALAGVGEQRSRFATLSVLATDILAHEPDPDLALNNWDRFVRELDDPREHIEMLLAQPRRLAILLGIFSRSQYLADTLIRDVQLWNWITAPGTLDQVYEDGVPDGVPGLSNQVEPDDPSWLDGIRRWKRREILRIGTRDLYLGHPLRSTTTDLSRLADGIVTFALARVTDPAAGRATNGSPFCILAFGKLGGSELNYSSDIDLLGVYDDNRSTPDDQARFAAVMHDVVNALSQHTVEGIAYRVDMRLRPFGRAGPLVSPFSDLVAYYDGVAQPWEIQALLKLRAVAGNLDFGNRVIAALQPHLLQGHDASSVWHSIRELRAEAVRKRSRSVLSAGIDVKNGEGGIRDIEFLVQGLQLLHASRAPGVLTGSTLDALDRLQAAACIGDEERSRLTAEYIYLRHLEHCLQIMNDRATHALPSDEASLRRISRQVSGHGDSIETFQADLDRRMDYVRNTYLGFVGPDHDSVPLG